MTSARARSLVLALTVVTPAAAQVGSGMTGRWGDSSASGYFDVRRSGLELEVKVVVKERPPRTTMREVQTMACDAAGACQEKINGTPTHTYRARVAGDSLILDPTNPAGARWSLVLRAADELILARGSVVQPLPRRP